MSHPQTINYHENGFDITILRDPDQFTPFKQRWDEALAKYPLASLCSSADYLEAIWQSHSETINGAVLMIEQNNELLALAPLSINAYHYRGLALKAVGPLDFMRTSRTDIPILGDISILTPIIQRATKKLGGELWHLDRIPSDSPVYQYFANSPSPKKQMEAYQDYELALLDTRNMWDEFIAKKSKNFRKNFRRMEENCAGLRSILISENQENQPQNRETFIANMIEIMEQTWKSDAGSSFAQDPRRVDFFRRLITTFGEKKKFVGAMIFDGERPVAFTFGLIYRDTLYAIETAYRYDYANLSPGINTYAMIMKHAFEHPDINLCDMDTIRSNGEYKRRWATHFNQQSSALVFNGGFASAVIKGGREIAKLKLIGLETGSREQK